MKVENKGSNDIFDVFLQSQADQDKLTCYYYDKDPLLLIKPVKVEMANLEPDIYLLHDIIRDSDIEFIKNLAAPRVGFYQLLYGTLDTCQKIAYRIKDLIFSWVAP